MSQDISLGQGDDLVLRGTFERSDGTPIAGAAVHEVFLGDPPSNCGTVFDLEDGPAHTDDAGRFRLTLTELNRRFARWGPPGTWRRGCFAVVAAKDARTVGYVVASGEELSRSPARLVAVPTADIRGKVQAQNGLAIHGARVSVWLYMFFVGRGQYPNAPVNFWLSRPSREPDGHPEQVNDLFASTGTGGDFVIPNAPMMPGRLSLTVSHPDFATLEAEHYPYQPTQCLTLQAGAVLRLHVVLPDGRPAVGFRFNLEGRPEGMQWGTYREEVTDTEGRCEFRSLPPCGFIARYHGGGERPWAVPAVRVPNLSEGERREIPIKSVAGSILCGRVCESGSETPIYHAEVRFESENYSKTASTIQACYTDEEGKFTYDCPLAPGPLEVCVSACHLGKRVGRRHTIVVGHELRTACEFILTLPEN